MIHLRRGVESWLRGSSKSIPRSVKFFRRWVLTKNARSRPLHGIPTRSRGITGHLDIGYRWTVRPEASTWWRWEIRRYILLYDDCWKKYPKAGWIFVEPFLGTRAFLLTRPQKMWTPTKNTVRSRLPQFLHGCIKMVGFCRAEKQNKTAVIGKKLEYDRLFSLITMVFLYNENPWNCCRSPCVRSYRFGPLINLSSRWGCPAVQVQPSCTWKTGVATTWFVKATWGRSARHDFTRLSGVWESEVPGGLGGWCNSKDFLPEMLASKKVPRYSITVFKDELINSGNQLKQFPGNPCIFIAFFELKNMTCRKGRIAEYIREMDDLVENFGPGWGFGEWNRRCVFFAFFCFGEDLHIPLAFGAIAGFWTCFLAVYLNVVFWASECPVASFFLFFLPSPYLQSLRFQDGSRTFQGCYILFGSVSVFPAFPATEDELETQRQAGSCYKCTILTFLDFWSAEAAEDQSTSCWLRILCGPKFQRVFPWNGRG